MTVSYYTNQASRSEWSPLGATLVLLDFYTRQREFGTIPCFNLVLWRIGRKLSIKSSSLDLFLYVYLEDEYKMHCLDCLERPEAGASWCLSSHTVSKDNFKMHVDNSHINFLNKCFLYQQYSHLFHKLIVIKHRSHQAHKPAEKNKVHPNTENKLGCLMKRFQRIKRRARQAQKVNTEAS